MDGITVWSEHAMRGRPVPPELTRLAWIQAGRTPGADFESDPLHSMEVVVFAPGCPAAVPAHAAAVAHFLPVLGLADGRVLGYWLHPAESGARPKVAGIAADGAFYVPARGTTLAEALVHELTPHPSAFRHLARRLAEAGVPIDARHPAELARCVLAARPPASGTAAALRTAA